MSSKLTGLVLESSLPRLEKMVMWSLTDHCKSDGSDCFPSVQRICFESTYSERQVRYALDNLESMGILMCVSRGGNGLGDTQKFQIVEAKIPRLTFDEWKIVKGAVAAPYENTERVQLATQKGAASDSERVQPATNKGAVAAPEPNTNLKPEPKPQPQNQSGGESQEKKSLALDIARGVVNTLEISRGFRDENLLAIAEQAEFEIKSGATPEQVIEGMAAARRECEKKTADPGKIPGITKFFGDGKWRKWLPKKSETDYSESLAMIAERRRKLAAFQAEKAGQQ